MELKKTINILISSIILTLSIVLILLLFLTSYGYIDISAEPEITGETNTTGVPAIEPSNHSDIDGEGLEIEVFKEVNEIRRTHGKDPFVHSERVRLIARLHSVDMAKQKYFNHTSHDGNNPRDRHRKYDGCEGPNENIARIKNNTEDRAAPIVDKVVSSWKNSSGHNTTMMSEYYNVAGVGVYVTQNKSIYVTMNFCREHPNA